MNPLTLEWIQKAEGDFATLQREIRARSIPNYDGACFHAQQVAEKYLKAILQENKQNIPKTHILADLLALCVKIDPLLNTLQVELQTLEGYAVDFRYPGHSANKKEALEALRAARIVRNHIRGNFGLN